jgi:hypothetical protein
MSKYLLLMLEKSGDMSGGSQYSKKKEVVTHNSLDSLPVERSKLKCNTAPHNRRISKKYALARF